MMFGELTPGNTYDVGVNSCSITPNQTLQWTFEDILISSLRDDDGDGRYTGTFTYNPIAPRGPMAPSAASIFRLSVTYGGLEQSYDLSVQSQVSATVRDALTQQPIANAALTLLGAQLEAGAEAIFSAWTSAALGQPSPQTTGIDGAYSFNSPGSVNRVDAVRSGYQPYRSYDLVADNGAIAQDIDLTPEIAGAATHTIYVTEHGFEPATLKVAPGSIIEWVNVDLGEHTTTNATWDSGVLSAGQSYKFKLSAQGTYTYADDTNPENTAVIVVEGYRVYLPLILR
jgi:plastocyanin